MRKVKRIKKADEGKIYSEGDRLRDEGMAKVSRRDPKYTKAAHDRIDPWLEKRRGRLTTGEKIKHFIVAVLGPAPIKQWFGAFINGLVKAKKLIWLEKESKSVGASNHSRPVKIYKIA